MCRKKKRVFILSLMLTAANLLSSCAKENCEAVFLPVYPVAGPKVAEELSHLPAGDYSHFWEWLARINKLRLELAEYRNFKR